MKKIIVTSILMCLFSINTQAGPATSTAICLAKAKTQAEVDACMSGYGATKKAMRAVCHTFTECNTCDGPCEPQ